MSLLTAACKSRLSQLSQGPGQDLSKLNKKLKYIPFFPVRHPAAPFRYGYPATTSPAAAIFSVNTSLLDQLNLVV